MTSSFPTTPALYLHIILRLPAFFKRKGERTAREMKKITRTMQEKPSRRQGREGSTVRFCGNQVVLTPSLSNTKNTSPKISPTMALKAIPVMETSPI